MQTNLIKKLYNAICNDQTDVAEKLLEKYPEISKEINTQDADNKETSLFAACSRDHTNLVRKLLAIRGIDVNIGNSFLESPLHIATRRQNVHIVRMLLSAGALLLSDNRGSSALHYAAARGNIEILKQILKYYSYNVNDQHKKSHRFGEGNTPLHVAISKGYHGAVKLLLKNGADTEIRNCNQYTPLYIGVKIGSLKIVRNLVKYGAKLEKKCKGKTALQLALDKRHSEIAHFLKYQSHQKKLSEHHTEQVLRDSQRFHHKLPVLVPPTNPGSPTNSHSRTSRNSNRSKSQIGLPDIQLGMACYSSYASVPNTVRSDGFGAETHYALPSDRRFSRSSVGNGEDSMSLYYEGTSSRLSYSKTQMSQNRSVPSLGIPNQNHHLQDQNETPYGSLERKTNEIQSLSSLETRLNELQSYASLESRLNELQSRMSIETRLNYLQSRIDHFDQQFSESKEGVDGVGGDSHEKYHGDQTNRITTAKKFQDVIRRNFELLVKNLLVEEHLDYLYQNYVLSEEEIEIIENGRHRTDKARKLLRTLLRKPNRAWVFVFVESLKQLPHCEYMVQHLFKLDSRLNSADYVYKL